jgi:hypothetical protein
MIITHTSNGLTFASLYGTAVADAQRSRPPHLERRDRSSRQSRPRRPILAAALAAVAVAGVGLLAVTSDGAGDGPGDVRPTVVETELDVRGIPTSWRP